MARGRRHGPPFAAGFLHRKQPAGQLIAHQEKPARFSLSSSPSFSVVASWLRSASGLARLMAPSADPRLTLSRLRAAALSAVSPGFGAPCFHSIPISAASSLSLDALLFLTASSIAFLAATIRASRSAMSPCAARLRVSGIQSRPRSRLLDWAHRLLDSGTLQRARSADVCAPERRNDRPVVASLAENGIRATDGGPTAETAGSATYSTGTPNLSATSLIHPARGSGRISTDIADTLVSNWRQVLGR